MLMNKSAANKRFGCAARKGASSINFGPVSVVIAGSWSSPGRSLPAPSDQVSSTFAAKR